MMKVDGSPQKDIYSGKEVDSNYLADKAAPSEDIAKATQELRQGKLTKESQIAAGKLLYSGTCSTCHQANGEGIEGVFPPLAKSDYLMADKNRSVGAVLNGLTGKVTVNQKEYNSVMPPMSQLNDDEIANILTFVRNSWGNSGDQVTTEEVTQLRKKTERPAGAAK
jgi:nitrite reductase (NO-forming)